MTPCDDGDSDCIPVTSTLNCDGETYPIGNLCGNIDLTYSDEYTDAMLWEDLGGWSPDLTCAFVNSRGEFALDIEQQIFPGAQPADTFISSQRACWVVRAPEGYTGYMKVWIYKSISEYDDDGVLIGGSDTLYATYEGTGGGVLGGPEILSIPTTEGTNQHVQLYIRNYTCEHDLDCDTEYPYPAGCFGAGDGP